MVITLKIVVGIQCRLSSKRLPGKALLKLSDTTIMGMTIMRSIASRYETYLLTSDQKEDDIIEEEGDFLNVNKIIRGPLMDVMRRYLNLAEEIQPDYIVRVTADNPLTEYGFIKPLINSMQEMDNDYALIDPYQCADGINLEIFTPNFLMDSYDSDKSKFNKEHVTPWMRNQLGAQSSIKLKNINNITPPYSDNLHFGVDTLDDYIKVRNIINYTESKNLSYLDKDFTYNCVKNVINSNFQYPDGRRHYP